MTLKQQEDFLKSNGWSWHLDALAVHRDRLTEQESKGRHVDGIVAAKRDYYAMAVGTLADRLSEETGHEVKEGPNFFYPRNRSK